MNVYLAFRLVSKTLGPIRMAHKGVNNCLRLGHYCVPEQEILIPSAVSGRGHQRAGLPNVFDVRHEFVMAFLGLTMILDFIFIKIELTKYGLREGIPG